MSYPTQLLEKEHPRKPQNNQNMVLLRKLSKNKKLLLSYELQLIIAAP